MLKKKEQAKFIEKRSSNILLYLQRFGRKQDEEDLHQLRVEVKKLKGFMSLSSGVATGQKLSRDARHVFKQAGIIRTAHLNLHFIQEYRLPGKQFKKEQEHIVRSHGIKFSKNAKAYKKIIKKDVSNIQKKIKPMDDPSITGWYKSSIAEIRNVFRNFDKSGLHEARKTIKNLLHVHGMLDKSLTISLNINIEYLEQLQEVIGKWHDVDAAYELLVSTGTGSKAIKEKFRKEIIKALKSVRMMVNNFPKKLKQKP